MTTPVWAPGTLYQPGALVTPRSYSGTVQVPPDNPSFETGTLDDWTDTPVGGGGSATAQSTYAFDGSNAALWAGGAGSGEGGGVGCHLVNDFRAEVEPGRTITAKCRVMSTPLARERHVHSGVRLYFYNASNELLTTNSSGGYNSPGTDLDGYGQAGGTFGTTGVWRESSITAVAPPGAASVSIGAFLLSNQGTANGAYVDAFSWDYIATTLPDGLVFRAVQTGAGYSGAVEPSWPAVNGQTVVDNEVTWEATIASRVVWEATPILVSGAAEPTWPLIPGGTIENGTIAFVAMDHRVKDEKCPHSKIVAIAAGKVYAADGDIVPYCETINPLNWSTPNDAGYIAFGMNTYGATPAQAMGLYRGNLVIANEAGYQMWQVDQDPANIAILDAVPVGCRFHRSMRPVSNDLVMLTDEGIRNIGIAGASTNIQAGFFGKQIDPLVKEALAALEAGDEARGLFWPGAGQYWLFFGDTAFVLTMNGGAKDMSWSRYIFPEPVTDWTLHEGKLLLRMGDTVLEMDEDILGIDDAADSVLCDGDNWVNDASETSPPSNFTAGVFSFADDQSATVRIISYDADVDDLPPYITFDWAITLAPSVPLYFVYQIDSEDPVYTLIGSEIDTGSILVDLSGGVATSLKFGITTASSGAMAGVMTSGEANIRSSTCLDGIPFEGYIAWHYLDFGVLGTEKQLEGIDLVCTGEVAVTIGYNQRVEAQATAAYTIDGDTLTGAGMLPFSITAPSLQFRLTFSYGQFWEWSALNVYLTQGTDT